jgi:hypothetical protein
MLHDRIHLRLEAEAFAGSALADRADRQRIVQDQPIHQLAALDDARQLEDQVLRIQHADEAGAEPILMDVGNLDTDVLPDLDMVDQVTGIASDAGFFHVGYSGYSLVALSAGGRGNFRGARGTPVSLKPYRALPALCARVH